MGVQQQLQLWLSANLTRRPWCVSCLAGASNKAWALALDWSGKAAFDAAPDSAWNYKAADGTETQGGIVRSANGFTFLQVFGAGHMVRAATTVVRSEGRPRHADSMSSCVDVWVRGPAGAHEPATGRPGVLHHPHQRRRLLSAAFPALPPVPTRLYHTPLAHPPTHHLPLCVRVRACVVARPTCRAGVLAPRTFVSMKAAATVLVCLPVAYARTRVRVQQPPLTRGQLA